MHTNVSSNGIRELDARSFDETIQQGIVLVAFCEPWCGPCHLEKIRLEQLAGHVETPIAVGAVDIDKEPELADRFRVLCIPALLLFKDGQLVREFAGVLREATVIRAIRAAAGG